ncbi:hypothetical protein BASA81_018388 [Batrachochytrium salamandrivorans]|nr:hypothetical protein BASA81_018388 [Batrachochytrium salamandrivorans]
MTPRVDNALKALWVGVPVSENENRMIVVKWNNSVEGLTNTSKGFSATVVDGGSRMSYIDRSDYPQTFWGRLLLMLATLTARICRDSGGGGLLVEAGLGGDVGSFAEYASGFACFGAQGAG